MEAGTLPPIPTKEVDVPGGEKLLVRGIGLHAAVSIFMRFEGELSSWFNKLAAQRNADEPGLNLGQAATMVEGLVVGAPDLAVAIIAAGLGMPGSKAAELYAREIGMGVQLDALTKIAELTFSSDMPPKKFLETVVRLATTMRETTAPVADEALAA